MHAYAAAYAQRLIYYCLGIRLWKFNGWGAASYRRAIILAFMVAFFGYNDRVIDNMLEPEDRDAFYTMEDIGVLQTEREETTLYDGREWRIHYWILNVNRIIELSKLKTVETSVEKAEAYQIYEEIPDEYWKMN